MYIKINIYTRILYLYPPKTKLKPKKHAHPAPKPHSEKKISAHLQNHL